MRYYIASKLENHAAHNRLRDEIHADGKEHPYQSGQLARLTGYPRTACPYIDGCGPAQGWLAGWDNPSNE